MLPYYPVQRCSLQIYTLPKTDSGTKKEWVPRQPSKRKEVWILELVGYNLTCQLLLLSLLFGQSRSSARITVLIMILNWLASVPGVLTLPAHLQSIIISIQISIAPTTIYRQSIRTHVETSFVGAGRRGAKETSETFIEEQHGLRWACAEDRERIYQLVFNKLSRSPWYPVSRPSCAKNTAGAWGKPSRKPSIPHRRLTRTPLRASPRRV